MTGRLLQALSHHANHRGLVIVREAVLLDETRLGAEELRAALKSLEDKGAVEILSPLPFLVLKLKKWSGKSTASPRIASKIEDPADPRYSSYSFNKNYIDKSKAIEDGGAGEGDGLLQEILATLGESDPTTFRGVLEHYPATRIRAVLERVRSMPHEKLRKSKTALFRFLLAKTN